ncbi:DUF6522 family protein [Afifella marina]|nr:DUF6522 family protein [Afifella marina]MBK1625046.1 hypothetical protein [Afifella marina DSM 2698]MBK1628750.1 hypothetical protein [Afifella marina]MBK5918408.1 hypothetical protein [Afifella marina]RAI19532.1 hypothetical protein CH311_12015 [Afifella marina DSM 2698]
MPTSNPAETGKPITRTGQGFDIDAGLLADAFALDAEEVRTLMRRGEIKSRLERGQDRDAGTFRLVFFHNDRRATFVVDDEGHLLRRTCFTLTDLMAAQSPGSPQ